MMFGRRPSHSVNHTHEQIDEGSKIQHNALFGSRLQEGDFVLVS